MKKGEGNGSMQASRVASVMQLSDPAAKKAFYDSWADSYDKDLSSHYGYQAPQVAARLIERLVPLEADILDVACGTGRLGELLEALGFDNLHGCDYSEKMMDIARAKQVYQALDSVDLSEPMPYASGSFDAVAVVGLPEIVDGWCFHEFVRVTKNGGVVLYCSGAAQFASANYARAAAELERAGLVTEMEGAEEFPAYTRVENPTLFLLKPFRVTRRP